MALLDNFGKARNSARIGDIEHMLADFDARLPSRLRGLGQRFGLDIRQRKMAAATRQITRDCAADATAGTCYHRHRST
jgi:hypothetical protein